jgi:hypothetical protein
MKTNTVVLTTLWLVALALVLVGSLRLMLIGIFIAIDIVAALVYLNALALDARLHAVELRLGDCIGLTVDTATSAIVHGQHANGDTR